MILPFSDKTTISRKFSLISLAGTDPFLLPWGFVRNLSIKLLTTLYFNVNLCLISPKLGAF